MYKQRREKLLNSIEGNCTVVLFSGNLINDTEDECFRFSVNRNFYYLTGLDKESMALVLNKVDGVINEYLFILPFDEKLAKWVGGRMLKAEAGGASEIDNVSEYYELDGTIASILNRTRRDGNHTFYFDLWHYDSEQALTPALKYVKKLQETHPAVIIKDIFPYITKMRLIKDTYEIADIKRAIEITRDGVHKMMTSIKPGFNEMVLDGIFNLVLAQNVCNTYAFKTICASGKRATILHYSDNNHTIEDGDMFLCDLGATVHNYCADISRTFPSNGKFSERQKELYNIVLKAQIMVEEHAKPGVTLRELNQVVVDFYREELPKHGLTKDVNEYYWHSVSHHMGLDDHDADGGLGQVLQKGNVISNEPGLYIESEKIGIRIEDDLLITEDGCENLSIEIVKTVEDIEEKMKGYELSPKS